MTNPAEKMAQALHEILKDSQKLPFEKVRRAGQALAAYEAEKAQPAEAVADERAAFEAWATRTGQAYRDPQYGMLFHDASTKAASWLAWQARATLAASSQAAPNQPENTNAQLASDSNATQPGQQRQLDGALALGQSLAAGANEIAGDSESQGAIALVTGMDEFGPMLSWFRPWTTLAIGTRFYLRPPQASQAEKKVEA